MFHLLQSERRRRALRDLAYRDAPVDTRPLHTGRRRRVRDDGRPTDGRPAPARYISLSQSHLPTFDEHTIVDYDQSRGLVRPTVRTDELAAYLSADAAGATGRSRWPTHYLLPSVVCTLVLAATWYEASFLRSIPGILVGALVTASFGASALGECVHRYCRTDLARTDGPPTHGHRR